MGSGESEARFREKGVNHIRSKEAQAKFTYLERNGYGRVIGTHTKAQRVSELKEEGNLTELMTLQEVASYLRVADKTIHRLLGQRGIPATRVGHSWRFEKDSIDRWLQQNSVGAQASVLVVDDEGMIQALFKDTLEELGHKVTGALNGSKALELVERRDFDLAFLDLKMPGMDGAELFRKITGIKPNLTVIIITGYPDSDLMARALAQGPFAVMTKPFDESEIIRVIDVFLKTSK